MTQRRDFIFKLIPLAGAAALLPRAALADVPALTEEDGMAKAMGFRSSTDKVDQAKYPKHAGDQVCAKCLHYATPAADTAKCDLFSKIVPKGAWCSGYSRRP
jgi:hypothetical protein